MAAVKDESSTQPRSDSKTNGNTKATYGENEAADYLSVVSGTGDDPYSPSEPGMTTMSRTTSADNDSGEFDSFGQSDFPPVDRLTIFDILENFALPQRLESLQNALNNQAEKVRKQKERLASRALPNKSAIEGWRKRVKLNPDEQLEKYRSRMNKSVDRLSKRFNDSKSVTLGEKISFLTACLNIFISAYLIGAFPEYFHYWYTVQLAYFMPIRWYKYHKTGYHYFLADLCYYTNFLLILTIWFFPQSKRLFISTYCLALGNNAVAIALWRNSLVLHSLDKVTSLFIHIMPCATLHVLVHLIPESLQREKFPAIHTIKYSPPDAPEHYSLRDMIVWATLPYAVWQLSYHFLITVRKRKKIAAGNPTSFTWLKRSYSGNFLGKFVLSCPEYLQEPIFMCFQYSYAMLTILPCPIWFWYRWAGAAFLMVVFAWASWNGATYYIDVFGRRMEKELNQLKKDVARMSNPELSGQDGSLESPQASPAGPQGVDGAGDSSGAGKTTALDLGPTAQQDAPSHRGAYNQSTAAPDVDSGGEPAEGTSGFRPM
ncbi:hypothetical protein KC332_g13981 [Hortaea werneckii]|uniref:Glycerophosphocholine acyltransferase 1 n=1 Tax=Hortaea werneckii EXF-2000 TaxID=1157616 RepID=A0A1Z5T8F8_HORWE|nr:hypothetical protein KC350_g13946 [Hortaea werneckii]OTA32141.1 hypothetical protein BTJ68_07858 [Hortaea werneckii EXF-2000]KAI6816517.1 hypothetical protein KC358_g10595 [Hortaea werneckii]KAI6907743.1 hypothetical protein KC348_g14125 [Hortaea werneckii]KAI6925025.1 hypothetical protein KC341_g13692 [Hortaea werneckii]